MEICFEDADNKLEEKKFYCILAKRLGITLENASKSLKEKLSSCPLILES